MLDEKTKTFIRKTVFSFLDPAQTRVFIFGSRAIGKNKKFSDIDIGLTSSQIIPWWKVSAIEEAFEESNLPQTVDVVDFNLVSEKFKQVAEKDLVYL
ncbi:MAG: nucleotidyltransferase domain-containing protein [Candidatus Shapirobacteria bacterium]